MKHTVSPGKDTRTTARDSRRDAPVGRHSIAMVPPAYGVEIVDRAPAGSVPASLHGLQAAAHVQRMANDSARAQALVQQQDLANQGTPAGQTKHSNPVQRAGSSESSRGVSRWQDSKAGLPESLQAGIEGLSGYSMDDVQVHYNSMKPARLNAQAFTQGTDIHVAPGYERHLAHEAWHVVQQKQGRVAPTIRMKGVDVNDDAGLEREADVMGARAMARSTTASAASPVLRSARIDHPSTSPVQGLFGESLAPMSNLVICRILNNKYGKQGVRPSEEYIERLRTDETHTYNGVSELADKYLQDRETGTLPTETPVVDTTPMHPEEILEIGLHPYRGRSRKKRVGDTTEPVTDLKELTGRGGKMLEWGSRRLTGSIKAYRGDDRDPVKIKLAGGFKAWHPMDPATMQRLIKQMYGSSFSLDAAGVHETWIHKTTSQKHIKGVMTSLGLDKDSGGFAESEWFYELQLPSSLHHVIPDEKMLGELPKYGGHGKRDPLLLMDSDDLTSARHVALLAHQFDEITFLTPIPFEWIVAVHQGGPKGRSIPLGGLGKLLAPEESQSDTATEKVGSMPSSPISVRQLTLSEFTPLFDRMLMQGHIAANELARRFNWNAQDIYDELCEYDQQMQILPNDRVIFRLRGG